MQGRLGSIGGKARRVQKIEVSKRTGWDKEKGVKKGGGERERMWNNGHLCLEKAFLSLFRVQMSGFQDLFREKPSSLFMLSGWSSICHSRNDAFHTSKFPG
jgi:hypothetical protein